MQSQSFVAKQNDRLDSFLTIKLQISRNQISYLIKKYLVSINGKTVSKCGVKLKFNDEVKVTFLEAPPLSKEKEVDFDVDILFEDDYILVINKPTGVTVHPAPTVREATLVEWLRHRGTRLSTIYGEDRHGIVHRLDKGTSGAMVIAKTNEIHGKLALDLSKKRVGRFYLALIDQCLKDNIIVNKAIARNKNNRVKMGVSTHIKAKESKTSFVKLKETRNSDYEIIACKLFSGRTHQIRVHLESISRRIIGDPLYGFKSKKDIIDRIFLHAYILYLTHPISGKKMEFIAPLPEDLRDVLNNIYTQGECNELYNKIFQASAIKSAFNFLY